MDGPTPHGTLTLHSNTKPQQLLLFDKLENSVQILYSYIGIYTWLTLTLQIINEKWKITEYFYF